MAKSISEVLAKCQEELTEICGEDSFTMSVRFNEANYGRLVFEVTNTPDGVDLFTPKVRINGNVHATLKRDSSQAEHPPFIVIKA